MILQIVSIVITLYVINKYLRGAKFVGNKPDLTNSVAVVTGGNTGIGKQTALDLARQGCSVIIGARDIQKSEKAVLDIKKITGSDKIYQYPLDLSEKQSIQSFVNNIKADKIDYLINNAGIISPSRRMLTKGGLQIQYAVNHLGHFYLTYLLWKKLNKSTFFRVITVSSCAHKRDLGFLSRVKLNFQDMNFEKTKFSMTYSYSLSKLYNVLFTKYLAEKIPENRGMFFSLHPGLVRTELTRYIYPGIFNNLIKLTYPIYLFVTKSSFQGAQTTLHLIYSPKQFLHNGQYYADCTRSSLNPEVKKQNWDKLWEISQNDLGIKFQV